MYKYHVLLGVSFRMPRRTHFRVDASPRDPTPLLARNAGLSVLKCQATDKPKALILRRGPHRRWSMDPVSTNTIML